MISPARSASAAISSTIGSSAGAVDRPGAQAPHAALGVVGDGAERLVDLVRQPGRHLAHGAEAQHVRQLGLVLARLLLGALALGDVLAEHGRADDLAVLDDRMQREQEVLGAVAAVVAALDLHVLAGEGAGVERERSSSRIPGGGTCASDAGRTARRTVSRKRCAATALITVTSPSRSIDQIASVVFSISAESAASERRSSASACLRSVMSVASPQTPTGLPSASSAGELHRHEGVPAVDAAASSPRTAATAATRSTSRVVRAEAAGDVGRHDVVQGLADAPPRRCDRRGCCQ